MEHGVELCLTAGRRQALSQLYSTTWSRRASRHAMLCDGESSNTKFGKERRFDGREELMGSIL